MFYLYLRKPGSASPYMLTNNHVSIYAIERYKKFCENSLIAWGQHLEGPGDRHQLLATANSYKELVDQLPELFI